MNELDILELLLIPPNALIIYNSINTLIFQKLSLKKLSKYNDCIFEDFDFENNKQKKLEHTINNDNTDKLLPLINKLIDYTIEDNLNTIYNNLNTLKLKKQKYYQY